MLHNNLKLSNNFLNVCYAQSVTTKYNNCFIQVYLCNIGLTAKFTLQSSEEKVRISTRSLHPATSCPLLSEGNTFCNAGNVLSIANLLAFPTCFKKKEIETVFISSFVYQPAKTPEESAHSCSEMKCLFYFVLVCRD